MAQEIKKQKAKGKTQKKCSVVGAQSSVLSTQPLTLSTQVEVEGYFLRAIEIARRQNAKLFELRATMSLSRFWRSQGKQTDAQRILAEVYGWFTEGFESVDLKEARELLAELEK